MQKPTLFLGRPLYSIVVTLFAVLVFTGLGSVLSERWFRVSDRRVWWVPVAIALFVGLFALAGPWAIAHWVGLPLAARIAITILYLAPLSLALGVPFAYGIRSLNRFNPEMIPWAWAVNGSLTVIGSILSVVLSMNFGFTSVLLGAVVVYFISFAAIDGATS